MRVRTDGGEEIVLKYFVPYGESLMVLRALQHTVPNAVVETEDGKLYRAYRLNLSSRSLSDLNPGR